MAHMLIEDSFVTPDGAVVVTGRPQGGDLLLGATLLLVDGTTRHEVTLRRILRVCARAPADVAVAGINAGMELADAPSGLDLRGLLLTSDGML